MVLPTLYTIDSKGKTRQWDVKTDGANIVVSYGVVGGKIADKITTAKAKNVGKSNETTPEQQAELEAKSKWTFQIDREDYNPDVTQAGLQLRPMLAMDFLKVGHRVNWNDAYGQPKLDGLRLTYGARQAIESIDRTYDGDKLKSVNYNFCKFDPANQFELLTRKGEVYVLEHLRKNCDELLRIINNDVNNECIALDGEAYLHGMPLQQINSRAKKYKKGETERLEYHLFDLVIPGMAFVDRHAVLESALAELNDPRFKLVDYVLLESEDDLNYFHGIWREQGYEGAMIRHGRSDYAIASRSPDLFKYKHFHDDEFQIVSVWEDKNGNAMFTVQIREGQKLSCNDHIAAKAATFDVTPKRSHQERKEMLDNVDSYIGGWLTVKYQDLTEDGIPTFPVGLATRDCDENGKPIA